MDPLFILLALLAVSLADEPEEVPESVEQLQSIRADMERILELLQDVEPASEPEPVDGDVEVVVPEPGPQENDGLDGVQ